MLYDGKYNLTHCGLVAPHGDKIWDNIASGNGLLLHGTKPLSETMLIQESSVAFIWGQFHKKNYIGHLSRKLGWISLI